MTEVPMKQERYLLDMPYEILFEIFRELPRGKLFEISRFFSQFENVARDTRLWKNVYIKYESSYEPGGKILAFEKLYSGPSPVKVIDLSRVVIGSPVSFESDQVVKVTKLIWYSTVAEKATIETMLAKYQFTELYLDRIFIEPDGFITEIAPKAFSNQTNLEVLSLRGTLGPHSDMEELIMETVYPPDIDQWVPTVLSQFCKNLKSLDLSHNDLTGLDSAFVESLPTTLEKLYLIDYTCPKNPFFELLAEGLPNLKEIGLCSERLKCPALLKFKFLETLHIHPLIAVAGYIRGLYKYLIRFPALKNVHMKIYAISGKRAVEKSFEALRTKLEPHGIAIFRITKTHADPTDGNLWEVKSE